MFQKPLFDTPDEALVQTKTLPSIPIVYKNTFKLPVPMRPLSEIRPTSPMFSNSTEASLTETATATLLTSVIASNNWMGVELIALRNLSTSTTPAPHLSIKQRNAQSRISLQQDNAWAEATKDYPQDWLATLRAFKLEYESARGEIIDLKKAHNAQCVSAAVSLVEAKEARAFTELLLTRTIDAESTVIAHVKRVEKQLQQSRKDQRVAADMIAVLKQSLIDQATFTIRAEAEVQLLKFQLQQARNRGDSNDFTLDEITTAKQDLPARLDSKTCVIVAQSEKIKASEQEVNRLDLAVKELTKESDTHVVHIAKVDKPLITQCTQTDNETFEIRSESLDRLSSSDSSTMTLEDVNDFSIVINNPTSSSAMTQTTNVSSSSSQSQTLMIADLLTIPPTHSCSIRTEEHAVTIRPTMTDVPTQTDTIEHHIDTTPTTTTSHTPDTMTAIETDKQIKVTQSTANPDAQSMIEMQGELSRITTEYALHRSSSMMNPKAMEYFKLRDANEQLRTQVAELQRKR